MGGVSFRGVCVSACDTRHCCIIKEPQLQATFGKVLTQKWQNKAESEGGILGKKKQTTMPETNAEKKKKKCTRCLFVPGNNLCLDMHNLKVHYVVFGGKTLFVCLNKLNKQTLRFYGRTNKVTLKDNKSSCCFTWSIFGGPCHLFWLQTVSWGPYFPLRKIPTVPL